MLDLTQWLADELASVEDTTDQFEAGYYAAIINTMNYLGGMTE